MTEIDTKVDLIVQYETIQARRLAERVIFKPPLTVWYILIPVIFVYYFYRLSRYANSRKEFVEHYMRSRRRAVETAAEGLAGDRPPDIEGLVARSSTPGEAKKAYRAYTKVLVAHYTDLLKAGGEDMDALLRSAYRNRGNYLLYLNQLGRAERDLDQVLAPVLAEEHPAVGETIALIEQQIEQLRRSEAERIFP